VTILIPAKDEGERIRDCIASALAQDYPDFNVIAVDDRSTDSTGAVMDDMARANPRLTVVHIRDGELPAGWTGKCNALSRAVSRADGDFLLFIDSDVIVAPDALTATVSRAVRHKVDLLSLLPTLETHGFWESALIPLAASAVTTMFAISLTNKDYMKGSAFANGQYLFMRRTAYDAIGGHATVRDKYCEDIELARHMKPLGYKVRISWGAEFAAVRMYSSLEAINRGWARIFFAGSLGRPWRMLAAIAFVVVSCYTAYVAAAWGVYRVAYPAPIHHVVTQTAALETFASRWGWMTAAAIHLALLHSIVATMYAWSGNRRRNSLAFPLGAAMLIGIFLRALRMCVTKKVVWRGTTYSDITAQQPPQAVTQK
jgi:glycosyltransferase involved in cell wall biosynthesis